MQKLITLWSLTLMLLGAAACSSAPAVVPMDKANEPTARDVAQMVQRTLTQFAADGWTIEVSSKASSKASSNDSDSAASERVVYMGEVSAVEVPFDSVNVVAVKSQIEDRLKRMRGVKLVLGEDETRAYDASASFEIVARPVSASYDYRELMFTFSVKNLASGQVAKMSEIIRYNLANGQWE